MANSYLENLTDEERAANLEKARQARIDKKEWAQKNLDLNMTDDGLWRELASKYNVKLPVRYEKAHSKFVNRALKALGKDKSWYEDHVGLKNGNEEARLNPRMTAVQQIGLILECYEQESRND